MSAEEGRKPEALAGQGSSFPVDAALVARPVRERPEAEYRRAVEQRCSKKKAGM
jgi:hypothetical protein